ncbi:MAG: hypothetical protein ACI865_000582 [Flavobacteriaceae bacterium]
MKWNLVLFKKVKNKFDANHLRNNCIFVGVKFGIIISLTGLFFLLTACPGPSSGGYSALDEIKNNGMDFPNLRSTYYKGIRFELSQLFERDYSDDYVLTDDASTHVIYSMDLNFSLELFDTYDAETIQYAFDGEIDMLNAIHDNYLLKRQASLELSQMAIKKPLPKRVGYPGFIQVIHGTSSTYGDESSYFTATMEVGTEYFVFQLIGKRENMGYLYDDFIDLLCSVHK